jgi:thymidylate kinase
MILLIEGVNRVGKTTLATRLAQDLDWPILKFNVPPANAYEHFKLSLSLMAELKGSFIVDRCHLSNRAYQEKLGGGVMDFSEWSNLDEWLRGKGAWLFLLVDNPFDIEARLQKRPDKGDGAEHLSRSEIAALQSSFDEAYQTSAIEVKGHFTLPQFIDQETGWVTDHYRSVLKQIQREVHGKD